MVLRGISGDEAGMRAERSKTTLFAEKALRKSVDPRVIGELASQLLPDPALAQALPVPVGHSAPETGRTSRPLDHASTVLG